MSPSRRPKAESAPPLAAENTPASLREKTLSGVKWMSVARLVAESTAFASSIVLARLVAPDEFGRTAVAVFLGVLAQAVAQQGTGSFLVSHQAPTRRHFEAASWVSIGVGIVGTALVLLFAVTLAPIWFGERTAYFVALSSPVWLLTGLTAVPIAQIQRELSFGRLSVIQASASVVGPVAAVLLAVSGLEGESIVIGGVLTAAVTATMAWLLSRPARPRWRSAELRELLSYGGPASGSSVLFAAARNIDYVLLAAFVPAFQVGLYMRAFALGSDYQSKISQILLSVAFPVLSRATSLDEVRRMRARMVRVHAVVLFPLLFGLIAVAPHLVPWMYGERWAGAGELTQILAVGGMIAAVGTGTGPLLLATGHARALFTYNLVGFVSFTLAVLAAVPFGVTAVCVAVVAVRLIAFVSLQYLVVERKVGIPVLETVRDDVIAAVTAGVPQLLVTLLGLKVSLDAGLPVVVAMALPGAVGLALYAGILRTLFPGTWKDLRTLLEKLSLSSSLRGMGTRLRASVRSR